MSMKTTSFGTLTVLVEVNGKPKSEYLVFEKSGRSHEHDEWEICYVTSGTGVIIVDDKEIQVRADDVCKIPPGASHYMIPTTPKLEILLVYANQA